MNPTLPLHVRRGALRSCISQLPFRTYEGYNEIIARYDSKFGFNSRSSTEHQLLATLRAIVAERNLYLEKLRAFERKRIRAKSRGRRTFSKADQQARLDLALPLYPIDRF